MSEEQTLLQAQDSQEQSEVPVKPVSNGDHSAPVTQSNISLVSASEIVAEENDPSSEANKQVEQPTNGGPEHSEPTDTEEKVPEKWTDVLGNKQLMKRVIRTGQGVSTRPTPQSRVRISLRGWLESGDVVEKQRTIILTVGDGDVIQALDLAVTLMETGEIAEVKTSPRFAYGSAGREPEIPPNATLTYEVELLEVLGPIDYSTISQKDLLVAVDKKRVKGNEVFQRKEFERAVMCYQRGIQMLKTYLDEREGAVDQAIVDMQIRCWNNVAAAQLKLEMLKEVLESCDNVLERDPTNVKALFRSGKVLSQRGEMAEAIKRLGKASNLNPEEKAIKQELQRAIQRHDQMKDREKEMYQRMVGGKTTPSTSKAKPKQESGGWMQGPLPYLTVAMVVATLGIGIAYYITQRH